MRETRVRPGQAKAIIPKRNAKIPLNKTVCQALASNFFITVNFEFIRYDISLQRQEKIMLASPYRKDLI
jgi:hypothetical protein